MVLVLNGVLQDDCPMDSNTLFLQHPVYRDHAQQLLSIPTKQVGPIGLLYVGQREMAAAAPHDKNINIIGTDDATTCIIVVVRHSGSGAVALAHFDGTGVDEAVCAMVARVHELALGYPEGRIELQLIGGYRDPQGYGEDVFYSIMQSFHKHSLEIDLTQACVGELNTILRGEINYPIIYGVGVNIKTGEIFPATFLDRGPDAQLRQARIFMGAQAVLDIYDSAMGMLRIGPFNYDPMRGADLWLAQSDAFLLQHLSTSPDVEPPHFANQMRATIRFIQENQFPAVTVFRDNRPRYFRRDETTGCWVLFIRSDGVAVMSTFAGFGAILAPFVPLLGSYYEALPFLLFGAASLSPGILGLLLPETFRKKLLVTVDEAIALGKVKRTQCSNESSTQNVAEV